MRHNGKHLEKIPPGSARAGREPAVASRAGDTEMALLMSGAIAPRWGCFGNGTTVDTAPVGRAGAAGRTETAERPATVRRRNGAEIHRNAGWNPSGAAGGRWWGAAAPPPPPRPSPAPRRRAPRRRGSAHRDAVGRDAPPPRGAPDRVACPARLALQLQFAIAAGAPVTCPLFSLAQVPRASCAPRQSEGRRRPGAGAAPGDRGSSG